MITIEIFIGYSDGTWDTDYINIEESDIFPIEDIVDRYMIIHIDDYENAVFWGIYNIPNDEED